MLDAYKSGPIIGSFIHESPLNGKVIQLDFNKYYTSILKDLKYIPVVNSFDNFEDYNGEIINDNNLYFCEKLNDDYNYPLQKLSLCYGVNIRGLTNITIISYLKISKIKESNSDGIVQKIYDNKEITVKMKKDIFNHIVGKYNKQKNDRHYTSMTTDFKEALDVKTSYGGRIIPLNHEGKNYYINYIRNSNELSQGFRLISLYIYDTAHKILLDLKNKLNSYGLKSYYCNTDCLHIEDNNEKLGLFMKENNELFQYTHKDNYDAIGKLKIETKYFTNDSLIKKKELINIYETIKEHNVINNIELNDEFNRDELSEKINEFNHLIIKATCAGAGKTSAFTYNAEKIKENTLFITPYNALCFDLRKKGHKAITLHKLLGLRFDGEEGTNCKSFDITNIQRIVFDEIYLYPVSSLEKIKEFMTRHNDKIFNATGDEFQLSPIQDSLTVSNTQSYYNKIITSLFPNVITLNENKRCKTDEDRQRIKDLTLKIRKSDSKHKIINILKEYGIKLIYDTEEIDTEKNVCALNRTCESVNELMYNKLHPENKYYIYQDLICRKSFKQKSKQIGFVNFTYTILDMDERNDRYTLSDGENDNITITKEQLITNFKLPYARTCHSLQGLSVDEKLTIFDLNHWMVDNNWIYTAITRTTDLNNIQFYINNYKNDGLSESLNKIKRDIENHKIADKNARREVIGEYVDHEWVINKLKNNNKCFICQKEICDDFSIDRINNNLSHTKSNCQVICLRCNTSKH